MGSDRQNLEVNHDGRNFKVNVLSKLAECEVTGVTGRGWAWVVRRTREEGPGGDESLL